MAVIEADVRYRIDKTLENKGWILDPANIQRDVFFESGLPGNFISKLGGKRPDYTLFDNTRNIPIGVIEAKKIGTDLDMALEQGTDYAKKLNASLIFAVNGTFCKTRFLENGKELYLNGNEVKELLRVTEALRFIQEKTNDVYTVPKEVIKSREELIKVFADMNEILRGEGLRAGIERFSEFANILFLKLLSENNNNSYWDAIKNVDKDLRIGFINGNEVHEKLKTQYGGDVFTSLLIKNPNTLETIIARLDPLHLSYIDEDIKGGAFEYFLEKSTSTENDLGEYFTPRHIIRTMVNLIQPKLGEKIYDPFCGTGGFLTETFRYIKTTNSIRKGSEEDKRLKTESIYGTEITATARIAKMNMILYGDGHSGVIRGDSLKNPQNNKYDVVMTNPPFSQKIVYKDLEGKTRNDITTLYEDGLAKNSGDGVCLLHCFRSLKKGGRMAIIVPEGFLFRKAEKDIRQYIIERSKIHSIISLPQGCFLPYTPVKTNILYLTDVDNSDTKYYWYFKVENDGYSLNAHRRKIDAESDLDKISASSLGNKLLNDEDIKQFNKIGIKKIDIANVKNIGYKFTYKEDNKAQHAIWPMVKLGNICTLEYGKGLPEKNRIDGEYPVMGSHGRIGFHNDYLIKGPAIIIGRKGSSGEVIWEEKNCYPIDTTYYVKANIKKVNLKWLYFMMMNLGLKNLSGGTGVPGLNRNDA